MQRYIFGHKVQGPLGLLMDKCFNETMHAGFSREKEQWFDRWYRALQQDKTFEMLRETILSEELKNHVPVDVRIHLEGHKVTKLRDAGVVADRYELAHRKSDSGARSSRNGYPDKGLVKGGNQGQVGPSVSQSQGRQLSRKVWDKEVECYYCHAKGHVKSKCTKFRRDQDQSSGKKPVGLVCLDPGMAGFGVSESHRFAAQRGKAGLASVRQKVWTIVSGIVTIVSLLNRRPVPHVWVIVLSGTVAMVCLFLTVWMQSWYSVKITVGTSVPV